MTRLGLDSFSCHVNMKDRSAQDAADWFLDRVVELGLEGCQFDPMHLNDWDEHLIGRISDFCAERGLYLELGSGGFDYERLSHRLEVAARSGARAMRTFIHRDRHSISAARRQELMDWAVESFKRLAEVAERVRVPLALENHEDYTSKEIARMLDAVGSPFICALVDTGNGLSVGEDPVSCATRLAPYAAATHVKDWRVRRDGKRALREGCALGEGDARAAEVCAILTRAKPDMPLTMELAAIRFDGTSQTADEEDGIVRRSIEFARSL